MGLDVKEIQVCIRKVLNFFITSCCMLVNKYPVVSGILFFFFLLYMLIPSLFSFLIFSLPILIFIVVAFRLIFRIHQQNLKNAKGQKANYEISSQIPSFVEEYSIVDKKEDSSCVQTQLVRRRNAKEKDKQACVQDGEKEKDMASSTISKDDLIDKTAMIEENLKEIQEVKVDSVIDHAESSSVASHRLKLECPDDSEGRTNKFGSDEGESENSDDAEDDDEEEEEEEEDTQEDGTKAVEWTEDDQKNLLDLGNSEMERNKRLEGLIAKRKARKLLSIQVRKTLMNLGNNNPRGQIDSILIPKGNPFPTNSSGEPQVSPTPGSAPSVLLPMHNPFDIPYDSQEEKPNLTGKSFEDEFIPAQQKDMILCKHKSFSLGAFFPGPREFDQSRRETFGHNFGIRQSPECSRLRNQTGKEGTNQLIPIESFQEGEPMLHINSSHDHARQQGQACEQVFNLVDVHGEKDRSEVHTEPSLVKDATGGSSSSSSSKLNLPISTANKDEILKSPSFSVSKNIAVDKEDNARRNELLYDISTSSFEKKRLEQHFFYTDNELDHTHSHSMASDLQVEVSEVSSPVQTIDGTISPLDGESMVYDGNVAIENETTSNGKEKWVASSNLSRVEENESRSREVSEVSEQDIIEVGFSRINHKYENPVESGILPEKVVEEDSVQASVSSLNTKSPENSQTYSIDFSDKVHDNFQPANTSYSSKALLTENLASSTLENAHQSTKESEAHPSHYGNSQKPKEQSFYLPETSTSQVIFTNDDKEILGFIKDTYGEAPLLIKREALGDLSIPTMKNGEKSIETIEGNYEDPKNDHSKSTEYFGGELQKQNEKKHIAGGSNLIGNKNVQDRKDEQGVADIGSSRANHNSDDPDASVMKLEIVAEQGPTNSSSSSSPASMTKDALHLTESLVTYPSNVRDPEKLLEPCTTLENSTKELNIISSVNDPEVPLNHDMGNLKIIKDTNIEETISKPIVSNGSQHEQQGEHKTLESYKPDKETNNSKSSEYFEPEHEKQTKHMDMVSPSMPIEETNIWESRQERACEKGVVDVGFFGNDSIPSTMPPELVVKQVPIALSSPSSPKYETQKMVSMDPAPSSNIDPEKHLKVQKHDEEQVENKSLDEHLPANLNPTRLQTDLSLDSTAYSSRDKDLEKLEEPSNPSMKSTRELNSIDSMKDSEVPPNDEMKILKTIDDINNEAHVLIKEENDPNPQETVEIGISEVNPSTEVFGLNQSFINDPNPPSMVQEVVVEQVPNVLSSLSSPKSVLEKIDQTSASSFDQELQVVVQQSEREMEENNMLNGLPPANLTTTMPQNALHLMEDSTAHPSNSGESEILQDASNYPGKSVEKDSVHFNINNSASNENEEKLNLQSIEDGEAEPKLSIGNSVSKPVKENKDSETTKRIEEFGESMKSKDVGGPSIPTNCKENFKATEVVEGKSDSLTTYEANVVGPSKPVEQNDDSNIFATSKEREESFRADPRRSIEEADNISSEHNVMVGKEELSSGVGDTQKMRPIVIDEQSENAEVANPSSIKNLEGNSKKITQAQAMVGSLQPEEKNDNSTNTKDSEELEK